MLCRCFRWYDKSLLQCTLNAYIFRTHKCKVLKIYCIMFDWDRYWKFCIVAVSYMTVWGVHIMGYGKLQQVTDLWFICVICHSFMSHGVWLVLIKWRLQICPPACSTSSVCHMTTKLAHQMYETQFYVE